MLKIMIQRINVLKRFKTPLLTILAFLLGCTLTINLMPIEKTCRIDNTYPEYNMQASHLKDADLIILILSAPKHQSRRSTIRKTWLQLTDNVPSDLKVQHYFVIGSLGLGIDEVFHLSGEQSQFSDLLVLPVVDSYENLTEKVLKTFNWFHLQNNLGLNFKYLLKCDDDSFVRVDKFAEELLKIDHLVTNSDLNDLEKLIRDTSPAYISPNIQSNKFTDNKLGVYWGYFNGRARIKTSGKWKEANWIACDHYTPYALGGAYVLSRSLVDFIGSNDNNLRKYRSEDVSVGLWLTPVANILRIHDIRFDSEWTSRGCQNHYLVTHSIAEQAMEQLYKNILSKSQLCVEENVKRQHYSYNWTVLPSLCCSSP